jgi:hypothetical protein
MHHGIDIQARDGSAVYAIQPGYARFVQTSGPDTRIQVGNFIYWHIAPTVRDGQWVRPQRTRLGTVMRHYGHLHLSELAADGRYLNPLRPGGRVLAPWSDSADPVIGQAHVRADGRVWLSVFDRQSFEVHTSYDTPVLAPAAVAYRLYRADGEPVTGLEWALRGSQNLPFSAVSHVYADGAHEPGFSCFARRTVCRPVWRYRLAGGLAPALPGGLADGRYRLTVYASDWAGNRVARDFPLSVRRSRFFRDR